jgi:hypothetical protein
VTDGRCAGEDDRAIVQGFLLVPGCSTAAFLFFFDVAVVLEVIIVFCAVFPAATLVRRADLVWRVVRLDSELRVVEIEKVAFSRLGAR